MRTKFELFNGKKSHLFFWLSFILDVFEFLQQLQALHNNSESYRYLTYIFTKMPTLDEYLRMLAGLVLKNNLRQYYKHIPEDVRNYMKTEVVQCIGDPKTSIRRTVGTILTTIIDITSLAECPGLLQLFIQLLDSSDVNVIDGTLSALQKICHDSAEKIDSADAHMGNPLNTLIPKLFTFFTSSHEAFRRHALSCVNDFIVPMPNALATHMDTYIKVAVLKP